MKDNKYLIIDTSNVLIKVHDYSISAKEIFNNKKVSEKNQKIILKLCINKIFPVGDAIELLTGIPFDITRNNIKKEDGKLIINATDTNNLNIYIENELIKYSSKEVKEFYNNLKNSNDLEKYITSLNTLFKCNINDKNYEKKLLKIK